MEDKVLIALVADFDANRPSHIATQNALLHTADILGLDLAFDWLPTEPFEAKNSLAKLDEFDGIWGAPGIPVSSFGYINAIQHAREKQTPYLGT